MGAGGGGIVLRPHPDLVAAHDRGLPRVRIEAGDADVTADGGQVRLEIVGGHRLAVDTHRVQRRPRLLDVRKRE